MIVPQGSPVGLPRGSDTPTASLGSTDPNFRPLPGSFHGRQHLSSLFKVLSSSVRHRRQMTQDPGSGDLVWIRLSLPRSWTPGLWTLAPSWLWSSTSSQISLLARNRRSRCGDIVSMSSHVRANRRFFLPRMIGEGGG